MSQRRESRCTGEALQLERRKLEEGVPQIEMTDYLSAGESRRSCPIQSSSLAWFGFRSQAENVEERLLLKLKLEMELEMEMELRPVWNVEHKGTLQRCK